MSVYKRNSDTRSHLPRPRPTHSDVARPAMFSIMLFIFLCFSGMLAVLYHLLRSQERLCRALRDEHAQLRVLLRAVESRLDRLDGSTAPRPTPTQAAPADDPLLHLSFEAPRPVQTPVTDPALDLHFDPPTNGRAGDS